VFVLTALVWALTLAKVPVTWRNRHDPLAGAYWLALLSVALVITIDTEPVYLWLGSVTGLPNLGIPLSTAAGVGAGFWSQLFLGQAQHPVSEGRVGWVRRVGWKVWPAAAMTAVLVVCYPFGAGTHPNTFAMVNSPPQTWGELVMGVCLAVWAGYALIDIARVCWGFALTADRGALRLGMVAATLGCPLIGAWVIVEYGPYGIWSWRETTQAPWEHTLIDVLNATGLLGFSAVALGLGLPAMARRLSASRDWACDLRSYVRLSRLWHTVRPAVPTLDWPRYRVPLVHHLVVIDLRGRLYRRVVEIQDGYFALQPYRDAGYERYLASVHGDAWARRDALALLRAVACFLTRRRPAESVQPTTFSQQMVDDVSHLERVSRSLPRERLSRFSGPSATDNGDVVAVQPLE
jgi:hypothetical protein